MSEQINQTDQSKEPTVSDSRAKEKKPYLHRFELFIKIFGVLAPIALSIWLFFQSEKQDETDRLLNRHLEEVGDSEAEYLRMSDSLKVKLAFADIMTTSLAEMFASQQNMLHQWDQSQLRNLRLQDRLYRRQQNLTEGQIADLHSRVHDFENLETSVRRQLASIGSFQSSITEKIDDFNNDLNDLRGNASRGHLLFVKKFNDPDEDFYYNPYEYALSSKETLCIKYHDKNDKVNNSVDVFLCNGTDTNAVAFDISKLHIPQPIPGTKYGLSVEFVNYDDGHFFLADEGPEFVILRLAQNKNTTMSSGS